MPAQYRIDVFDSDWTTKLHEITEFTQLTYNKKRNGVGEAAFTLHETNNKIPDLNTNQDRHIQIWRKNPEMGLPWTCDFYGFIRSFTRVFDTTQYTTFIAQDIHVLLKDRIVAFPPDTSDRSLFENVYIEDIMYTLVDYNLTTNALESNGRLVNNNNEFIFVDNTSYDELLVDVWDCAEDNLLETLQQLATKNNYAFILQRIAENTSEFLFKVIINYDTNYDKTASVIFSPLRGNVKRIEYTFDVRSDKNIAIVGGKESSGTKQYTVVTNNESLGQPFRKEVYISATNAENADERAEEGSTELREMNTKRVLDVSVLQSPSTYYGLHYNVYDFVTIDYLGNYYNAYVDEAKVTFDPDNGESIDVTLVAELLP